MSKSFYKFVEIAPTDLRVSIDAPEFKPEVIEIEEDGDILEGKSIEQLKEERDEFERTFDAYKKEKEDEAEAIAVEIIEKAKSEAFEILKKKKNEIKELNQQSEDEATDIINKARSQAQEIESEIRDKEAKILTEARRRGYQEGWEEGIRKGEDEVKRLVERIQIVLNNAIEKRNEIFVESEQQIIGLVLLIAKKVIKVISENQKNVVINNVVQALRKLKSRGEVAIRVNLADLELTSQHKRDFIEMVEGVKSIKILEDGTVDRGGCIIETDFGSLDARISSQLHEIEERIVELIPIQSKNKDESPV